MKLWGFCSSPAFFFICDGFWEFSFCFSLFWEKNQTEVKVVQVYDYLYVQLFHFHLFGFIDFSLCVLPTTIGSESTNCDDPYQWYTMHRQIKFVMIPDGSSSAPAYSLLKTLPSRCLPLQCTHLFFTHWFSIIVFLPLTGGNGASARPVLPHLTAFLVLHLHCALGSVCCGTAGARSLPSSQGDAGNCPGTELQSNPSGARSCSCAGSSVSAGLP